MDVKDTTTVTPKEENLTVTESADGETHRASVHVTTDAKAERRLVWKFDSRILPVLAVMYFFNALDKGNIGNAKTAGLLTTLHMKSTQYNTVLSVFYVPYVVTAPVLGVLGKKYGVNRVLPLMMFTFGTLTTLMVATYNFSGLFAIRWFLGMSESAFFPLVIYYQTLFYRRIELARRLALFYAAQSIASAFSGLLSFGVFQIHSAPHHLASWRYLFLIEGLCTVVFAVFALWYLPRSAAHASFLTEHEKLLAYRRVQTDSSAEVESKFSLREALKIFRHGSSWVILGIEICLGVPLQGVVTFLPQIVQRLGYSTVKTNLYTVAPNISAAVMLLILAFASDYTRTRFPYIALGFLFTFIGFIIYAALPDVDHHLHAAYFATFMMTWGTNAPSVILDTWYNNNIADESRRIVLTSVGVPLANLMGLVPSNVFRDKDAPKYFPALITTAAFGGTGMCLTVALGLWMMMDNRKRNRRQGVKVKAREVSTELLKEGPKSEEFRWFL